MCKTVLPALHRVLGEECLSPKFYHSGLKHAILLKDLLRDNYWVFDLYKQLHFKHFVKSLKHLAKFHDALFQLNEISLDVLNNAKHSLVYYKYFQVLERRVYFTN